MRWAVHCVHGAFLRSSNPQSVTKGRSRPTPSSPASACKPGVLSDRRPRQEALGQARQAGRGRRSAGSARGRTQQPGGAALQRERGAGGGGGVHADAQQLLLAAAERVLRQAAVQRLVRVLRAQAHGQVGLQRLRAPHRVKVRAAGCSPAARPDAPCSGSWPGRAAAPAAPRPALPPWHL